MRRIILVLAVVAFLVAGRSSDGAIITSLIDNFGGSSVDSSKWNITNRGLENTGAAGYNAPSVSGNQLTLGGATTGTFWYGSSLESVNSFASNQDTRVSVDRVSLAGSGTAWRSSEWIYGDGSNFLHFSQNTENGWSFNCNGCGGTAGATGSGTAISAFSGLATNYGSQEMQMLFIPGAGSDVKIQLFLGNTAGPIIDFPNWTPTSFTTILTGQARQSGDTVNAVFAGFNAQVVPEPSSCMLIGLGAVGLIVAARRRKAKA